MLDTVAAQRSRCRTGLAASFHQLTVSIMNDFSKERRRRSHHGLNEEAAIQACVACFAGGLRDEQAGVTSGSVQRPIVVIAIRPVFGADRIVRAEPQLSHRNRQKDRNALGHTAETAQRPLTASGRRVDQDAKAVGLSRAARVDPLFQRGKRIAAVQSQFGQQRVRQGMQRPIGGGTRVSCRSTRRASGKLPPRSNGVSPF